MSRQIVLDTETTGLESRDHRIIEIGCIEMRGRRFVGEQRWYLNPDRDSDPGALEVHGLTTEFLADKPRFRQVADEGDHVDVIGRLHEPVVVRQPVVQVGDDEYAHGA